MNNRYEIREITDIFQVPEDKIDHFLVDLKSFYSVSQNFANLADTVADSAGIKTKTYPSHFVWIDDDKHDVTVNLVPKTNTLTERERMSNG